MPSTILTQNRLKELLHYDPLTGIFTWISKPNQNILIGSEAGHVEKVAGYIRIAIDKRKYAAHRLAFLYMLGSFPQDQVDHINHNIIDNRWSNLRPATSITNCRNKSLSKYNTSGFNGVKWRKERNHWIAQIRVDGKLIYLGSSYNFDEAVAMRQAANIKYGFHPNHGQTV